METRIRSIIKGLRDRDIDVISAAIEDIGTLAVELSSDEIREIKQPLLAVFLETLLRVLEQGGTQELAGSVRTNLDSIHELICSAYERDSVSVYETIGSLRDSDF